MPVQLIRPNSSQHRRIVIGYLLAPLLVATTTWALHGVQSVMAQGGSENYLRPYGIAFIISIIATGVLGGWACALLTLGLSLVASDLFLMNHPRILSPITPPEWIELIFLLIVGGAVLIAVEMLMRNVRLLGELAAVSEQRQTFFRDVLINVTDGKLNLVDTRVHLPRSLTHSKGAMRLERDTLSDFRHLVAKVAVEAGLAQERRDDLVTAAGECAMNAIVHGGGGAGRVYTGDNHEVQVWVEDHGQGIALEHLPNATLEKGFTTAGSMGFGMKMMLTSADRVWLLTGAAGTTVVLEQHASAPLPAWLVKNHSELVPLQVSPRRV